MSRRIALMGLGQMGRPIARHLAAKGEGADTVVAIDSDPARVAGSTGPGSSPRPTGARRPAPTC